MDWYDHSALGGTPPASVTIHNTNQYKHHFLDYTVWFDLTGAFINISLLSMVQKLELGHC